MKHIYEELKRRILFMEYEPGQILSEKAVAAQLGVSRTPVREAFLRLEWERLVEIIPRGGVLVSRIEFKALRDVFLIRIFVEGLVARLAATHISDEEINEIRKLRDKCRSVADTDRPEKLIKIDIELREIIHRAANSQILGELSDYLYSQTLRMWFLIFRRSSIEMEVDVQAREIDETLAFLSKRDSEEAEMVGRRIMLNHVERIKKYIGSFD